MTTLLTADVSGSGPAVLSVERVAVVGAGSWGTTVAALLAPVVSTVLWSRRPEVAADVAAGRGNRRYLDGYDLPAGLEATDDLLDAVTLTVLFSVFAHGFSATPLSNWYAGLAEHPDNKLGLPERAEVHEHPVRYTPMHLRKQRPLQHEAQTGNDPEDV